ncbi:MAG: plasmid pRiA4b ORF-3 family protein, partial [Pseudonocardia sp.]|nr:plasmid pRiA4b ORF-3 family protein [Pseudonocardia sp.]
MAARNRNRRDPQPQVPALDDLREQLRAAGLPPEIISALDGVTDIDEAIRRLVSAGLLPGPQEALDSILNDWKPLLRRGRGPLDAELAGFEFLASLRATGAAGDDLPSILEAMIDDAERSATPEALAMLRVLGSVGPPATRPVARAAADRLVASGLTDPRWVAALGRPRIGDCFGYMDFLGTQQVIAITFGYGRKSHAIAVLIDHGLGGGVKDCHVAERPRAIRAAYEHSARRGGMDVEDHSVAEAAAILDRALAAPPCPVEPDQIEDVDTYVPLLRERLNLMREPTDPGPRRRSDQQVYRLKITLRGSKPPIWRRVEVASTTDLAHLHEIIQATFGWHGYHMWVFTTAAGEYGEPDPELGHADAARRRLSDVAPARGDRIRYTYDFGDDWEHDVMVETITPAEPDLTYPRCVTGRRARPPEDCG